MKDNPQEIEFSAYYLPHHLFVLEVSKKLKNLVHGSPQVLLAVDLGGKKTGVAIRHFSADVTIPLGKFSTVEILDGHFPEVDKNNLFAEKKSVDMRLIKDKAFIFCKNFHDRMRNGQSNGKNSFEKRDGVKWRNGGIGHKNGKKRDEFQKGGDFYKIFRNYNVMGLIVGSAKKLQDDGSPLPEYDKDDFFLLHHKFGAKMKYLSQENAIPLALYDERYTTAMAHALMRSCGVEEKDRYERDDGVAAMIILDGFWKIYESLKK